MSHADGRRTAERRFCIQISEMLGRPIVEVDPGPVQSRSIARLTAAMNESDIEYKTQPDVYFTIGFQQMSFFLAQLQAVGFDLTRVSAVLEFGCGSARLLRLLRCLPGARLIGTDINRDCIDWCRERIPGLEFHVNGRQPPLDFLDDGSVDLILAHSVFTHIPLADWLLWLLELRRILSPGGILLCTVSGREMVGQQLAPQQLETLERTGELVLDETSDRLSLSSRLTGQQDVYLSRDRVTGLFESVFDILAYAPAWQDLLLLRRPR